MRQAVGFRDRTTVDAQKMVAQLDLAQHAVLIKVLKHKHRSDIHRHAKSNVLSLMSPGTIFNVFVFIFVCVTFLTHFILDTLYSFIEKCSFCGF